MAETIDGVRALMTEYRGDDYECNTKLFHTLEAAFKQFKQAVLDDIMSSEYNQHDYNTATNETRKFHAQNTMLEMEMSEGHEIGEDSDRKFYYNPDNYRYSFDDYNDGYYSNVRIIYLNYQD